MIDDLKVIKDNYGEKMSHLCRRLFPSLLEQNGLLSKVLLSKFSPNRYLYDDIIDNHLEDEFKNFIYCFFDVEKENIITNKSVRELLEEAGYLFYECHTEEEIQRFKKYYQENEELCTFNGGRLNKCYVFFAVKKNVQDIKREYFLKPRREDEYGTSVISIQFSKGKVNTLSIKNRYNHVVNNPDATFSNNLDNIISGLTNAFIREYNLNINYNLGQNNLINGLSNYVLGNDGKYYRYNYEIDNIYYCSDNIIIDNMEVKKLDKIKYILIDYFLIDLGQKKIRLCSNRIKDYFINSCPNIEKIYIENNKQTNGKTISIYSDNALALVIEINRYNQITHLKYNNLNRIGDKFLSKNKTLISFESSSVEYIGDDFLKEDTSLINFYCPNLRKVGYSFLYNASNLKRISFPELREAKNYCLHNASELFCIEAPNLRDIGTCFNKNNERMLSLSLPKAFSIGENFMADNFSLIEFYAPNVRKLGNFFLERNEALRIIDISKVKYIGSSALRFNEELLNFEAPELKIAGDCLLYSNKKLKKFYCPELEYLEDRVLKAIRNDLNSQTDIITKYNVFENKETKLVRKLSKNL